MDLTSGSGVASSGKLMLRSASATSASVRSGDVSFGTGSAVVGATGSVVIESGSTQSGKAGDVVVAAGASLDGEGGSIRIVGGSGSLSDAQGGSVSIAGGSGGDLKIQPGSSGAFELLDGSGKPRLEVNDAGMLAISSAQGQDVTVRSGANLRFDSKGQGSEIILGREHEVKLRIGSDKIIAQVPMQLSEITIPADARIADQSSIRVVDQDEILQRVMKVPVKSFTLTEEWRRIQGLGERTVRAAIGQEIEQMMPDWVSVMDELSFPEAGFALQKFYEVNDRQVLYDTLLSLQTMHQRLTVGPNNELSSGRVSISTADAGTSIGIGERGV
jgi:hypothetical protein